MFNYYGDIVETDEVENFIGEEVPGSEWIICDEDERERLVRDEIEMSAWAFNAWFILQHSQINMTIEQLTRIQEEQSESCNDLVLSLIDDFDDFVEDAVSADGYGHFLNRYDGQEYEFTDSEGNIYYIYATN